MKKYLFILLIILISIGFCCLHPVPDNDLWARFIAGEYIVKNLSILKYDFLSYTPTHIWYDHEWGASIFFYLVNKYFGDTGLIFLKGILFALTLIFGYKTIKLKSSEGGFTYRLVYLILMLLAASKATGTIIRCLMFTCFFYSVSLYILEKARTGSKRLLCLLPLIMLFWANIHGGCISLIGVLCVYILGEFLNKKSFKEYIFILLGCFAVLFINPYGIEYVKFLFYAAFMDRSIITEWNSSFHRLYLNQFICYKIYLFTFLSAMFTDLFKNKINYEKADKTKIILIILMAYLSIAHVRHQTFFVFTAGTLLYNEVYSVLNFGVNYLKKILKINSENFIQSLSLLINISIYVLISLIFILPIFSKKQIKITKSLYPWYAVEFVKINNIKGNLFINFDYGSYAAYKLYPNNLIVMDGRYEEVYNPDLLEELNNFHTVKNDWYKIIKDYKTDVMILEKQYKVYEKILSHPDWILVFHNNLYGVFIPKKNLRGKYIYPVVDDNYYNNTKFDKL